MLPAVLGVDSQAGDTAAEDKPPQCESEEYMGDSHLVLCTSPVTCPCFSLWEMQLHQVTPSFTPEPKINLSLKTKAVLFVLACQGLRLLQEFLIIGLSLSPL